MKHFLPVTIAATVTTLFFLTLTLLIYSCINELKDFHGKCIIGFLVSHIFAFIFSRVGFLYFSKGFDIGLICAFVWVSAMTFDVWWTLRYLEVQFVKLDA